ncbi:MAG: PIN domain-containing protein [bacterium]
MKRKIKVYLDTSVISAYFDERNPERQSLTELFFKKIEMFESYVSEVVLAEIDDTKDVELRNKLREKTVSLKILPIDEESRTLADEYVKHEAVPSDYSEDALHIAISTINEIDYLLSWNFDHIVKVKTRRIVNMVNTSAGYPDLEIITPAELL